jgi:hypothetical protein
MNARSQSVGDTLVNASRQVWLAGLGAAVVTRDWAGKEAATVFRNLVREGTAVESRAFRFVGDRVESSVVQANALWKAARRNVTSTVRVYADTAATIVRETLPASLPKIGAVGGNKRRPARTRKTASTRATPAKPAKRAVKRTKAGRGG